MSLIKRSSSPRNPKENGGWIAGLCIHTTTGVFVPLSISNWEIDLEKTYLSLEVSTVGFQTHQTHSLDKNLLCHPQWSEFSPNWFNYWEITYDDQTTLRWHDNWKKNSHGYFCEIELVFGDFVRVYQNWIVVPPDFQSRLNTKTVAKRIREVGVKSYSVSRNQVQLPLYLLTGFRGIS